MTFNTLAIEMSFFPSVLPDNSYILTKVNYGLSSIPFFFGGGGGGGGGGRGYYKICACVVYTNIYVNIIIIMQNFKSSQ